MKRVVITGLGIVSCIGNNQEEVHQSLLNSKSGISFAEEYKEHNLKSHVHGKPNIKLEDHIDRKTIRFMGSGSAYNYISMSEAVKDSVFRRIDGGVLRAQLLDKQLSFEPNALGLWQQKDDGLAVELRTDPLESRPHTQSDTRRAVASGMTQDEQPLWPILLMFGLFVLAVESWVLLADHRARAA